jgi:hypothetical protein
MVQFFGGFESAIYNLWIRPIWVLGILKSNMKLKTEKESENSNDIVFMSETNIDSICWQEISKPGFCQFGANFRRYHGFKKNSCMFSIILWRFKEFKRLYGIILSQSYYWSLKVETFLTSPLWEFEIQTFLCHVLFRTKTYQVSYFWRFTRFQRTL